MKKVLLFLAITISTMLSTVWAYDFGVIVPSGQKLYFSITSDFTHTVAVTYPSMYYYSPYSGYTEPTGDLVIPSSITHNGTTYSVTSIGGYAFSGCTGLTSVTIGNSVTFIGNSAFEGCSGLTSVTIPNSVTSIGNYAFSDCSGLTTLNFNAVNCSNFSSNSYYNPFYDCPVSTITIGDSVQRIPAYFAYDKTSLTSITIPNSVASIGEGAFYGCMLLREVISLATLPPTLGTEVFNSTAIAKIPCGSLSYYTSTASSWPQYFVGIEEMCDTTGIEDIAVINARVYSSHSRIVVEGADGNNVMLFDMSGRLLATKRDEYSRLEFEVPISGAYFVKIGNYKAQKIVVIK